MVVKLAMAWRIWFGSVMSAVCLSARHRTSKKALFSRDHELFCPTPDLLSSAAYDRPLAASKKAYVSNLGKERRVLLAAPLALMGAAGQMHRARGQNASQKRSQWSRW